jgi:hypothetical protein
MTSLEIREFTVSIQQYVNGNTLPLEVKRMVLENITRDVSEQTNRQLAKELEERDNRKKTENEAGEEAENNAESVQRERVGELPK